MKIRLLLTLFDTNLPALITVRSFNGRLIFYKNIYCKKNDIKFCTCSRNLIISVKPINAEYSGTSFYVKLPAVSNCAIRLNLDLKTSQESLQNFYLYDLNYNFPIISAVLNFYASQ